MTSNQKLCFYSRAVLKVLGCVLFTSVYSSFTFAKTAPLASGRYSLQITDSKLCLDVKDGIRDNGVPLQLWDCNQSIGQTFKIDADRDGNYKILALISDKSLDIKDSSTTSGEPIQQWQYFGGPNQTFSIIADAQGNYRITPLHSGLALGVEAKAAVNGSRVEQLGDAKKALVSWIIKPSTIQPNTIQVKGRQLLLNGKPFVMHGICWNPVRKGQTQQDGTAFNNPSDADMRLIETDLKLMKALGINTLRTYAPILDNRVLDLIRSYEMYVIVPVFNYHLVTFRSVEEVVNQLKDHPTTLLWSVGNEWNFNFFYDQPKGEWGLGFERSSALVKMVTASIRALDNRIPISTVYWGLPSRQTVEELTDIDVWSSNIYSGLNFGSYFTDWKALSGKPLFIAEYGADAVNNGQFDSASQTKAVVTLSKEIDRNLSAIDSEAVLIGGTLFEWNDEWWKHSTGKAFVQDIEGIAVGTGTGPYPDDVFNEEWWGLVDIERKPRPAYTALQAIWGPGNPTR